MHVFKNVVDCHEKELLAKWRYSSSKKTSLSIDVENLWGVVVIGSKPWQNTYGIVHKPQLDTLLITLLKTFLGGCFLPSTRRELSIAKSNGSALKERMH